LFENFKLLEISGEQQKYYVKNEHLGSFHVNEPIVSVDKKYSVADVKRIIISDETKDAAIYYTTDGSEPTLNSKRYKKPFDILQPLVIKTFAVKEKMIQSNVIVKKIVFGINIINTIYKVDYTKYSAGGNDGLYDREKGSENFNDGKWQGFEGNDMDVIFELSKQQKIKKITVGFLANSSFWIYFPVKMEIYASVDGKNFNKISTLSKDEIDKMNGDPVKDITISINDTDAKFVRIVAKNIEKCPDGDPGSGGKAWIFTDEVVIE
jgi:hexosaminidase